MFARRLFHDRCSRNCERLCIFDGKGNAFVIMKDGKIFKNACEQQGRFCDDLGSTQEGVPMCIACNPGFAAILEPDALAPTLETWLA